MTWVMKPRYVCTELDDVTTYRTAGLDAVLNDFRAVWFVCFARAAGLYEASCLRAATALASVIGSNVGRRYTAQRDAVCGTRVQTIVSRGVQAVLSK